jgi:von Willebrand factor
MDICAVKDTKEYYCSALNSYAMECARSNVRFDWRKEVAECGKSTFQSPKYDHHNLISHAAIRCPPGQTNQVCGDSCTRSCNDINSNGRCQTICVDGCNCPRGKTLDKNDDCIPVTECPCVYQGREYPAGAKNLKGNGLQAEIWYTDEKGHVSRI